jgi:hypothetical protein
LQVKSNEGLFQTSIFEITTFFSDKYLPICHGFLGQIFVEMDWAKLLKSENCSPFIPLMLKLLVKLAAEPKVRQVIMKSHLNVVLSINRSTLGAFGNMRGSVLRIFQVSSFHLLCARDFKMRRAT